MAPANSETAPSGRIFAVSPHTGNPRMAGFVDEIVTRMGTVAVQSQAESLLRRVTVPSQTVMAPSMAFSERSTAGTAFETFSDGNFWCVIESVVVPMAPVTL